MTLLEKDIHYFRRGRQENKKFWSRLKMPDFKNAIVLDVGCGHGRMCIDIAKEGAKKVIGIDINDRLIDFAKENLTRNFPDLVEKVEFHSIALSDLNFIKNFDFIISKDSFEHIQELDKMLSNMHDRLKPGGKIFSGFAPLYNSFYGDHKRTKAIFPWFHLIIPESLLIWRLNRNRSVKIKRIEDLGLNKYSLKDYKRIFNASPLSITTFKVNCSDNTVMKVFNYIRMIPVFEEYFSHNIYCILEK
jgi:SAM-dependent methyltransferase